MFDPQIHHALKLKKLYITKNLTNYIDFKQNYEKSRYSGRLNLINCNCEG